MYVWRVTKIGEDCYRIVRKAAFIDEEVNGTQFMGMLKAKHLSDSDIDGLLFDFAMKDVGYEREIVFRPVPESSNEHNLVDVRVPSIAGAMVPKTPFSS